MAVYFAVTSPAPSIVAGEGSAGLSYVATVAPAREVATGQAPPLDARFPTGSAAAAWLSPVGVEVVCAPAKESDSPPLVRASKLGAVNCSPGSGVAPPVGAQTCSSAGDVVGGRGSPRRPRGAGVVVDEAVEPGRRARARRAPPGPR